MTMLTEPDASSNRRRPTPRADSDDDPNRAARTAIAFTVQLVAELERTGLIEPGETCRLLMTAAVVAETAEGLAPAPTWRLPVVTRGDVPEAEL